MAAVSVSCETPTLKMIYCILQILQMFIITMKIYKTLHPIANIKHNKNIVSTQLIWGRKNSHIYGIATY